MGTRPRDRGLTSGQPFAHIGYMTKVTANVEDLQTTVILDAFKARDALAAVERERVTLLGGVPAQWSLMLRDPEFDRFDLSSVRTGTIGGAPFTPDLLREIRGRFRIELVTRYSATEIALGTTSRPDDPDDLLAETVGRAGSGVELRIVDERRRSLPVGEVAVRSPAVMAGYWNRPEETRAVLDEEGWFYTADLGVLDERGYLRLRGRNKEMYIRGGYNVFPVEVEEVLLEHPGVAAVAVVSVPDDVMGERGVAVVVARDPARPPALDELREFARDRLSSYKLPDEVRAVEALPLTAGDKLDRRALEASIRD
jgi:acyl-CoA synthetase (AMP-forming)/AMP-acid ligase II